MVMEVQEFNNAVNKNATFIHNKTKGKYKVRDIIRSKHPDTGDWYDAILYIKLDTSELFVRTYKSFLENFNVCK